MTGPSPLIERLEAAGYRLTEPRRAVAQLISAREGHFTAAELLADASVRGLAIGRATVFRMLELLTQIEALERVDLPGGGHAYVACTPSRHHHHVICESCGRVADVDDQSLASALEHVQRSTGWLVDSHRIELYGRCPRCRDARGPSAAARDGDASRRPASGASRETWT
jgi:Fur family ferric uptake transcriptional regulator